MRIITALELEPGAIAGALAAVGTSLVIPGLGIVIAGPAAAALAGAGAGGVTGGIIGALVGWGIPEERVKHYERGIKEEGIVMGVSPRSEEDAEYIEREWNEQQRRARLSIVAVIAEPCNPASAGFLSTGVGRRGDRAERHRLSLV